MAHRLLATLLVAALLGALRPASAQVGPVAAAQAESDPAIRLVVLVAVDQFRPDYLWRFEREYSGGLHRLLTRGAVFTNAYLEHYPTVTAVGHATMLSGATPSVSGIIGNDWFDRATGKTVQSITDDTVTLLGGQGVGASPARMLASTVGDEMKMAAPRGDADARPACVRHLDEGSQRHPAGWTRRRRRVLAPRSGRAVRRAARITSRPCPRGSRRSMRARCRPGPAASSTPTRACSRWRPRRSPRSVWVSAA